MKKLGLYLVMFSGWVACGFALYWGFTHCDQKNEKLVAKIESVETIKQNPIGIFVDSAGREVVQYKDGTTAKIPSSDKERKNYTMLRDSLIPKMMLTGNDKITAVAKVATETKMPLKQADLLNMGDSLQVDKWSWLYRTKDGFIVKSNNVLNRASFTRSGGLFGLKKTPMLSFFMDNPNSKISGYEKYETPLPLSKPFLKVDLMADYDFVLKNAKTDISATFRIGKFNFGGFGRLNIDPIDIRVQPSYGARIVYNLAEL